MWSPAPGAAANVSGTVPRTTPSWIHNPSASEEPSLQPLNGIPELAALRTTAYGSLPIAPANCFLGDRTCLLGIRASLDRRVVHAVSGGRRAGEWAARTHARPGVAADPRTGVPPTGLLSLLSRLC